MLRFVVIVGIVTLYVAVGANAQSPRSKVIFFGDSITEVGAKGNGYIIQLAGIVRADRRQSQFELIGAGVSGDKVYDLYLRLESDVLAKSPDLVVIFIGVNDIWHKRTAGSGTDYVKFGRFYEAIVSKLQNANIGVVLCTPAVIGERTDMTNDFDGELNLYSKWIRDFAAAKKLPLVDLRKAFLDHAAKNNTENKAMGILTTDRVHLNDAGNKLVAEEIWKVLRNTRPNAKE